MVLKYVNSELQVLIDILAHWYAWNFYRWHYDPYESK